MKRNNRGSVLIIAVMGILLLTLLLLYFQRILVSQLLISEAMSCAEKGAYLKQMGKLKEVNSKVLQNYDKFTGKTGVSLQVKRDLWGVKSSVTVEIPYGNKKITRYFNLYDPGRLTK